MRYSLKNKIYILLGIFILLILSLVLFAVVPLAAGVKSDSENLISIKNSTAMLEIQNEQIENFKRKYQNYAQNLQRMDQVFIDPDNSVDFIKFLETTAHDAGISPQISLLPDSGQKDGKAMMFQLFASSDFLKMLHFFEVLENGAYLIEIGDLNIESSGSQGGKVLPLGNIDATVSIKAFTKP